ncbi:hypothetical protein [Paracidovorax citrulli]
MIGPVGARCGDETINPFIDPFGLLFLMAFVAVALAACYSGSAPVIGALPLWALVGGTVAVVCVILQWIESRDPELACRLAVAWSFLGCGIAVARLANRLVPGLSRTTPLVDPLALQWAIGAVTIALGATAVFVHFKARIESLPKPRVQNAGGRADARPVQCQVGPVSF